MPAPKAGSSHDKAIVNAGIEYAKKKVDALISASHLRKDDELPEFEWDELKVGRMLGKGAFGQVHEILAIDAVTRRIIRREKSERMNILVDPDETEVDQRQSREFISTHCMRRGKEARYAVKRIRDNLEAGPFIQAVTDILQETRFLKHLEHPHIIKMRAVRAGEEIRPDYFIVLDRLYDTLGQRMKKWTKKKKRADGVLTQITGKKDLAHTKLYEERLLAIYHLSAAFAYMHEQKLVYRDIKMENIAFDVRDDVKLFDFGLTKELHPNLRNEDGTYRLTEMTGSLVYMAPEVYNGLPYNQSCDCYSFAILWWELLALSNAFAGYTHKMLTERVFNGKKCRPTVDVAPNSSMKLLLRKSWSDEWRDRFTMPNIQEQLRQECIRVRGGDETGLDLLERKSTYVFRKETRADIRSAINDSDDDDGESSSHPEQAI